MVNMWNLGKFFEKLIFCPFCTYITHITVIIFCTANFAYRFYLIDFHLNIDFPFQFCVFSVKSATYRSVSQENAFKNSKKSKKHYDYRLKWFFYSNWKQFREFEIPKFEFKVTVHYGLWTKCTQLWLTYLRLLEKYYRIFRFWCPSINLVPHAWTLELWMW